jgi:catechol-2,3-dioxygenase
LKVLERDDARATLGAGPTPWLVLVQERGARAAPRSTGLYHFVSEALYLRDPDGHGIEVLGPPPQRVGRAGRRTHDHLCARRLHHLGANTWESAAASPPPPGSAALRHATLVVPDPSERDELLRRLARRGHPSRESAEGPVVHDPAGKALVLAVT